MEQVYDFQTTTDYTYPATISVSGGDVTLAPVSAPATYTEDFNDAVGLTFGASIEISGGAQAQLVLEDLLGQTFNEDFADGVGFTYNAVDTEFTGGLVQQISQNYKPDYYHGLIYASYNSSMDADYGTAPLTGLAVGTPSLSASKLACLGGGNNGLYYNNVGIQTASEQLTVVVKYTPNYNGSPAANRNVFELWNGVDNNGKIVLIHGSTGALRLYANNSAGVAQWIAYSFATIFNPVAGTEYEIMFTLDTSGATTACYVNGVSYGSNTIASFTRGNSTNRLYVGAASTWPTADGYFQDVILYDYIKEVGAYAPAAYGGVLEPTIYIPFTSSINAAWGDGVLTGTASGGAAISGGKLDLTYNDVRYVDYPIANNFAGKNEGCLRFKVTPNYTGSPVAGQLFIEVDNGVNNNSRIMVYHAASGLLSAQIFTDAGVGVFATPDVGAWAPTSGTEYEVEFNWSITNGASRIFVNGTQLGATKTDTGVKTLTGLTNIRVGTNPLATLTSNFEIDDILIFRYPQHTANYTPDWSNVFEFQYEPDVITLPNFTYSGPGNIQGFSGFTVVQTNAPRYVLNGLYWDGGAWAASSDTWATSSPSADVNTNIATLPAADTVTVKVITNGSVGTRQQVSDLSLNYTGQNYPTTNPTIDIDTAVQSATPGNPVASWNSFAATITAAGGDAVRFSLSDDAGVTYYYWSGAAWVPSAGYAQTNDFTTINTNIATFPRTADGMTIKVYLHSNAGTTTPNIGNLDIGYNDTGYSTANPKIYANATLAVEGSILNFSTLETVAGADSVTYTVGVDGIEMYWDGAAWSTSSGYPQTNTASQVSTNVSALSLLGRVTVKIYAYLHSATGLTTPTLTDITLNYDQADVVTQSFDLTTDADYDYDESYVQIVNGVASLTRLIPSDAVFYAPFTVDTNETWYNVPGTAVGGAAIAAGLLNLTGGTIKYVNFAIPASFTASKGCFQIAITPNYNGFPVADRVYGSASKAHADSTNLIELKHRTTGFFNLEIRDALDNLIINTGLAQWLPTAGQEYIFEVHWNLTDGDTRVFIDGTQLGATQTATGSRGTDVTILRVGTSYDASESCDYSCRYFTLFNEPQHNQNHTIEISDLVHPEEIYYSGNPTLTLANPLNATEFYSFASTVTATGSDEIRFALNVNGTNKYWNGTSWAKSTGYSQTNAGADISANINSLELPSTGSNVNPVIYFHSAAGLTSPSISLFSLSYEYQAPMDAAPTRCVISGYVLNALNQPLSGATVAVRPSRSFDIADKNMTILRKWLTVTTNSLGYFEMSLIASTEADGDPIFYDFKITSGSDITYLRNKTIPTSASVNLYEL